MEPACDGDTRSSHCQSVATAESVDGGLTLSQPPPLLPSVTSSQQPDIGSCHAGSPVAAAAIWAVVPGRSGADFASSSEVGRFTCTAEQTGGSYVSGDEIPQLLPYRDLVYPTSYQENGDQPVWTNYFQRAGGPLTADLPPASHHQSLVMSSCDPAAAYQVGEDWYGNYDYLSVPSSVTGAPYQDHEMTTVQSGVNRVQTAAAAPSSRTTTKRKRRRIITADQRRAANVRERRRMSHLNDAFDGLRKRVPTFAYEKKLSRIETLRLAVTYIRFMADLLGTLDGGTRVAYDVMSHGSVDGGARYGDGAYPSVGVHCDDFHHVGRTSTTFELSDADYDDEDDDDDEVVSGSCSPDLSCPGDVQEPLELIVVSRTTSSAAAIHSCQL